MKYSFISTFFKIIVALVFIAVIAFVSYFIIANKLFMDKTLISNEISINHGDSFNKVYNKIYKDLDAPYGNKLYLAKVLGFDKKIQPGYYIAKNTPATEFMNKIITGSQTQIKVTIPEGYNLFDIAKKLDQLEIASEEEFLSLVFDEQYIEYLTKEQYQSLEGFLFPGTYNMPKHYGAKKTIEVLYHAFKLNLPKDFTKKITMNRLSFYDAIKLASIVQKETYSEKESPIVAAVFLNRLNINMRLQADPTIIYGKYLNFDGNIRKVDIQDAKNKFNTYRHNGLPPTPISNPSTMALEAVMHPSNVDYLFFVANNKGEHLFAEDYRTHVNNVNTYQKK